MEEEKRTSENYSFFGRSGKRAREEDGVGEETTVTDEEVDEFFAILSRIHVAVNYFKKGNVDMRGLSVLRKVESMNLGGGVELNNSMEKKVDENAEWHSSLDLNADPSTGSDRFI